jgi:hypothetical protein
MRQAHIKVWRAYLLFQQKTNNQPSERRQKKLLLAAPAPGESNHGSNHF